MAKPKHIPPDGWTPLEIKTELHRQGMTQGKLAELQGMTPQSFSNVWTRRVKKAEAALSAFLEIPAKELFPDRYPERSARILSSKYEKLRASQKVRASTDKEAA